eukprot:SAG31_NODE_2735_length_5170_cov_5.478407_4_plen_89_part_00
MIARDLPRLLMERCNLHVGVVDDAALAAVMAKDAHVGGRTTSKRRASKTKGLQVLTQANVTAIANILSCHPAINTRGYTLPGTLLAKI